MPRNRTDRVRSHRRRDDTVFNLRACIKGCEKMETYYAARLQFLIKVGWYWKKEDTERCLIHYQSRRRNLIKLLQKHQIRNFKRD